MMRPPFAFPSICRNLPGISSLPRLSNAILSFNPLGYVARTFASKKASSSMFLGSVALVRRAIAATAVSLALSQNHSLNSLCTWSNSLISAQEPSQACQGLQRTLQELLHDRHPASREGVAVRLPGPATEETRVEEAVDHEDAGGVQAVRVPVLSLRPCPCAGQHRAEP
jgi:hypothetical protein